MAITLRDRVIGWLAGGLRPGIKAQWVPEWVSASFVEPTFRHITMEGYKANGAVAACVGTLAWAFPQAPLRVYGHAHDAGRRAPDDALAPELTRLLRMPNPSMSQSELMMRVALYLAIGGNCYLHKVRTSYGLVVELWPYSDAEITPLPDASGLRVGCYEYRDAEGRTRQDAPQEIIHLMWMPDPVAPYRGLSPIVQVAREVDTDNEAQRYIFALLKNDAVPRVALTLAEGQPPLSDAQFERQRAQWQARHGGDNRGVAALLEGGMDVKVLGLALDQLAMESLRRIPESRIAAVLRVPPIIAGLQVGIEHATYANYGEARLAFTEDTLVPMWRMVADEITQGLREEMDLPEDSDLRFDTSEIVALKERQVKSQVMSLDAYKMGVVTRNEARAALGYAPVAAGGEAFYAEPEPQEGKALKGVKGLLSYDLTDEDVDDAVERFEEVFPSLEGLLDAEGAGSSAEADALGKAGGGC
jgi:HK97 family phage portal protein